MESGILLLQSVWGNLFENQLNLSTKPLVTCAKTNISHSIQDKFWIFHCDVVQICWLKWYIDSKLRCGLNKVTNLLNRFVCYKICNSVTAVNASRGFPLWTKDQVVREIINCHRTMFPFIVAPITGDCTRGSFLVVTIREHYSGYRVSCLFISSYLYVPPKKWLEIFLHPTNDFDTLAWK